MSTFKDWNQDFLRFQKRSRIAILSLVVIGVLVIVGVKVYFKLTHPLKNVPVQISPIEKARIAELPKQINYKRQENKKWRIKVPEDKFNPNEYDLEDWMRLGYSQKQAASVMNFRASGFRFKVKSDLKKLFIMDDESYAQLYTYIDLPDTLEKKESLESFSVEKKAPEQMVHSINRMTKKDLVKLKGVGDYYATKVLNFRDALGGFVNAQQLKEVYHLPDSLADLISRNITIDTSFVKRHNINEINLQELKQHPYISYKLANSIIAYRKTHGAYSSVEELKELVLMNAETFNKVRPYLKVE